jgi:hypothetical protein
MRKFLIALGVGFSLATPALAKDYCHRPDEARLRTHGCYVNKDGDPVHRPADYHSTPDDAVYGSAPNGVAPEGATVRCRDGDFSFSRHSR